MAEQSCKSCLFYRVGECHAMPPVRLPRRFAAEATASARIRNEEVSWGWPSVSADDWCGNFGHSDFDDSPLPVPGAKIREGV